MKVRYKRVWRTKLCITSYKRSAVRGEQNTRNTNLIEVVLFDIVRPTSGSGFTQACLPHTALRLYAVMKIKHLRC